MPLSTVHTSQESSAKWEVGHKNKRGFLEENMSPSRAMGQDFVPLQTKCRKQLPRPQVGKGQ